MEKQKEGQCVPCLQSACSAEDQVWQPQNDPVCLWSSLQEHELEESCLSVWREVAMSGRYVREDDRKKRMWRKEGGRGGLKMRGGEGNGAKRERSEREWVVVEGG